VIERVWGSSRPGKAAFVELLVGEFTKYQPDDALVRRVEKTSWGL